GAEVNLSGAIQVSFRPFARRPDVGDGMRSINMRPLRGEAEVNYSADFRNRTLAIAKPIGRINEVATQALPLFAFYPQGNREQRLRFGI
ncbi:MAG: hypothetical protein ND895_25500, partial [Pyrinomonadaceae bacterium]|nr:hypothetical protein [Pyrinomonadaceae bacterium]